MNSQLNIGVLIPTRGNRPEFLSQCLRYLKNQTLQPDHIEIVDDIPRGEKIDITYRYKIGCDRLFKKGCDIIIFWEDDDFYRSAYIQVMINNWILQGSPELFGIGYTIYYHILENKFLQINHKDRASAMSTMVTKSILNINWPADDYPYLDVILWKELNGKTFFPSAPICMGIKHGIGLVGGGAHNRDSAHYNQSDPDGMYLRSIVGEHFNFYKKINHEFKV